MIRSIRKGAMPIGLATLVLLGTAACQREDPAASGGMFGGANKSANASAETPKAARGGTAQALMANSAAPAAPIAIAPATPVMPAATAGDGRNRQVRITNQSGQTITLIKGSPTSVSNWGQDRIPSGVLNAGATVMVDFNDNNGECVYDLQATMVDSTTRVQRGVNVCTVSEWVVTPDGSDTR